MRAGKLRHVVAFQRQSEELDELGQQSVNAWKAFATGIRSEVTELSGRELELARQQCAEVTISVKSRFGGAKTTDRIVYGKRIFEISARIGNERNTEFLYMCTERPQHIE